MPSTAIASTGLHAGGEGDFGISSRRQADEGFTQHQHWRCSTRSLKRGTFSVRAAFEEDLSSGRLTRSADNFQQERNDKIQ